jgi:cell division protein ZapA (FtsZ GTPase activity inhibitor)
MTGNRKPISDTAVFIKILDRGFNLSVPSDQEHFYREGYEVFKHKIEEHKKKGKGYDDIEAIALTSIECLVALQRSEATLNSLLATLEDKVDDLDSAVTRALER